MQHLKSLLKQFLSDGTNLSITRLITVSVVAIVMLSWIVMNIINIVHCLKTGQNIVMVDFQPMTVGIVLTVIGGKVGQSFAENTNQPEQGTQ